MHALLYCRDRDGYCAIQRGCGASNPTRDHIRARAAAHDKESFAVVDMERPAGHAGVAALVWVGDRCARTVVFGIGRLRQAIVWDVAAYSDYDGWP